jgi:hypothetical protein
MFLCPVIALGDDLLTKVSIRDCVHGLHQQPGGGPFAVFLSCDDALGANIGVINTIPGAGPGMIDLGEAKEWGHWDVNDRFWQERAWATDVKAFAWSPDLRSLYVCTSEVYGTGALYKLDLVNKTARQLLPDAAIRKRIPKNATGSTYIESIDPATGLLRVTVTYFDPSTQREEQLARTLK